MSLYMLTNTGYEHHLTGPGVQANQIDIYDIAWALSQINRFVGHCRRPYCVAEHSLLVADLAKIDGKAPAVQLACLLRDAHKAYTGELGSPHKNAIGLSWATFETLQADRVRRALNIAWIFERHAALINSYALVALATERQQLTKYNPDHHSEWPVLDTFGAQVKPSSWANLMNGPARNRRWNEWRDLFLERYFDLTRAVVAAGEQPQHQEASA